MPQARDFPPVWERASVVLIPKRCRPAGTPSSYRPICLLDEIALGPLLWDIAYNNVLRTALLPGCNVVCYADDTLLLAGGGDWGEAREIANLTVACVVRAIKRMGLKVTPRKTEAIYFHDGFRGVPPQTHVTVDDIPVQLGTCMKYLGLWLD
ncbi:reverse transcriptase [Lasius niger]|uniref:Reverse transcriptase n=1 Tax=Lasius niger TaxID=67767 RepID=A0A0J7K327_LASNI|nr:reverse transcriptase [Lasius niger]